MRKTIASALVLAMALTSMPALAKEKGSSGRQAQAKGTREIPRCTRNLGAIAIVEPDNQWWREYNLGSPEAILKIFVQQPEDVQQDAAGGSVDDPELARKLSRPVEELELSVRAANCLKAAGIKTIGDLVKRSEPEMLRFHNFGKKSLDEIRSILETMDLHLGMGSSDDAAVAEEVEETSETT